MTKKLVYPLALLFTVFACNKKDSPQVSTIVGRWNWVKTFTSSPNSNLHKITPATTGKTWTMEYLPDGQWIRRENNVTLDSGTYFVIDGKYQPPMDEERVYKCVFYRTPQGLKGEDFFRFDDDSLVLDPQIAGFTTSTHVRYGGGRAWFARF